MSLHKQKINVAFFILIVALLAGWQVIVIRSAEHSTDPALGKKEKTDQLLQLLQSRYDSALKIYQIEESLVGMGRSTLFNLCEAARRVRDASLELFPTREAQIEAHNRYCQIVRRFEESVSKSAEAGAVPKTDKELANYMRCDAEISLLKASK